MLDFLRPSFDFESTNPFRRSGEAQRNFYVQIRKYVLRNTRGSIRGRLNVSGPREIIGLFANHIFKMCYRCQNKLDVFKELSNTAKELPSFSTVVENILSTEKKTNEVCLFH